MQESNNPKIESVVDFKTFNKSYKIDSNANTLDGSAFNAVYNAFPYIKTPYITNDKWVSDPENDFTLSQSDQEKIVTYISNLFEIARCRDEEVMKLYDELSRLAKYYKMITSFTQQKKSSFDTITKSFYRSIKDRLPLLLEEYEDDMSDQSKVIYQKYTEVYGQIVIKMANLITNKEEK